MILHSGSCIVYKEAHVLPYWSMYGKIQDPWLIVLLIAKNTRKKFIAKSFVRMKFKDLK